MSQIPADLLEFMETLRVPKGVNPAHPVLSARGSVRGPAQGPARQPVLRLCEISAVLPRGRHQRSALAGIARISQSAESGRYRTRPARCRRRAARLLSTSPPAGLCRRLPPGNRFARQAPQTLTRKKGIGMPIPYPLGGQGSTPGSTEEVRLKVYRQIPPISVLTLSVEFKAELHWGSRKLQPGRLSVKL